MNARLSAPFHRSAFSTEYLESRVLLSAVSLLVDANTAPIGAEPSETMELGNRVIYAGLTDDHQSGLWVTDGTPRGTRVLKKGITVVDSGNHAIVNGVLYFVADDHVHGSELWRTDGTPRGTYMVVDLVDNPAFNPPLSSNPSGLANVGGKLVFGATPDGGGLLFVSDGTAAGTVPISTTDIRPYDSNEALYNGRLYFTTYETKFYNTFISKLYATDGTAEGTQLIESFDHEVGVVGEVQGRLILGDSFFQGGTASEPHNLYASNGVAGGTVAIHQFPNYFQVAANVGDQLLISTESQEMWRTDGTPEGTYRFGPADRQINAFGYLGQIGSSLYFLNGYAATGTQLLKLDRVSGAADVLASFDPSDSYTAAPASAVIGGTLYFTGQDSVYGTELWQTDGTVAGTHLAADVVSGPASSHLGQLHVVGKRLVFSATSPAAGNEIYSYTPATSRVKILHDVPGTRDSDLHLTLQIGKVLYFTALRADGTYSLFKTDGTSRGTVKLATGLDGYSTEAINFGGVLYFIEDGRLWRSNGTIAGSMQIDGQPGGNGSYASPSVRGLFSAFGKLFYVRVLPGGPERDMKLMAVDSPLATPREFGVRANDIGQFSIGGKIYLLATNYAPYTPHYYKLTATGAVEVPSPWPGPGPTPPSDPPAASPFADSITIGGKRYYAFDDGVHGTELWVDDGKHKRLFMDLFAGSVSSSPAQFAFVDGNLVFAATSQNFGREVFSIRVK